MVGLIGRGGSAAPSFCCFYRSPTSRRVRQGNAVPDFSQSCLLLILGEVPARGTKQHRCELKRSPVRTRLAAGGNRIRTIGPAENETAVERGPAADHRRLARRAVLNDPIQLIGPASHVGNSREPFHQSGTDGSNPVPSSTESCELAISRRIADRFFGSSTAPLPDLPYRPAPAGIYRHARAASAAPRALAGVRSANATMWSAARYH